jgi:hypothetical protein
VLTVVEIVQPHFLPITVDVRGQIRPRMHAFWQFFLDSASRTFLRSIALHHAADLGNQFSGAFALKQVTHNNAKNGRTADCEHPRNEPEYGMDCFSVHNRN